MGRLLNRFDAQKLKVLRNLRCMAKTEPSMSQSR